MSFNLLTNFLVLSFTPNSFTVELTLFDSGALNGVGLLDGDFILMVSIVVGTYISYYLARISRSEIMSMISMKI